MAKGFATGEQVYVEIDGERVDGVYIRAGELETVAASGSGAGVEPPFRREVAWVRRADTGEVEPFDHRFVSAG